MIRFECPSCQQPIETDETTALKGLNCPGCYKFFTPVLPKPQLPPLTHADSLELKTQHRRDEIRKKADSFCTCASIAGGFGVLVIFLSIVGQNTTCIGIGVALLGAAFWLYLVAQIIYIRANTEK